MNPKWLLLVGLVALPSVAQAESSFDHDLAREVAVPGGLTARQVTSRASSASHTVSARRAEVEAAAAGVDRALSAYMPRVTLSGRYARLSDPGTSEASNIVVAPGSPAGPLPPGAPLVNAPLSFPVLRNQWSFQAGLGVPLSDYVTRFGDLHAAQARQQHLAEEVVAVPGVEGAEGVPIPPLEPVHEGPLQGDGLQVRFFDQGASWAARTYNARDGRILTRREARRGRGPTPAERARGRGGARPRCARATGAGGSAPPAGGSRGGTR